MPCLAVRLGLSYFIWLASKNLASMYLWLDCGRCALIAKRHKNYVAIVLCTIELLAPLGSI